jgi:hypothetical protein
MTVDAGNSTMAVDVDSSPATVDAGNSDIAVDVDSNHATVCVDNAAPGTYDDLNNDIKNITSGSVYDVTRDYKFDGKGQTIDSKTIFPVDFGKYFSLFLKSLTFAGHCKQ